MPIVGPRIDYVLKVMGLDVKVTEYITENAFYNITISCVGALI